ncbi:UvrD-helicase domain-containing protein [Paenibacillus marinisediminis]
MSKVSTEHLMREDAAARDRIATDLDTTFLVEAGAGSGKTTSMVGRMIALIRAGRAEARSIAAITFTNKAASELKGRFRIQLEKELAQAVNGQERKKLEAALRQMPECFIGTIHAFCGRLLRERPIEAGLDPAFREMEEDEDQEFRDRCWDEYLEEMRLRGDVQQIAEIAALQIDVEVLRSVYNRVSEYEDIEIYTCEVERPNVDRIRDTLFSLMESAAPYIGTNEPEKGWDSLQKTIQEAMRHVRSKDMAEDMNVLSVAKLFDRTLDVTQNRWTDAKMAKAFKQHFQDWKINVLKPFLQSWREYVHPKLIAFVLPAVRYCRQKRTEAGKLNFQDLLMKASELLRSYPEVRAYFGRRYTRLFVDDFQDADPIQVEMMMLLTGADAKESDWRKQLPREGSLFVVGDPKQAIYRFRRADISTYNYVKQRIEQCGEVLQLTRNFRSVKSVGDYVNYAFESRFAIPGAATDSQAPFVRMITQRNNPSSKGALHGVYTVTIPGQVRDKQDHIADYDAEQLARYVAWACSGNLKIAERASADGKPMMRPARAGDFMILLKYRKYINLYAERLEKYGIAADTSGSIAVTKELRALALLALTLSDPTDRIPLLAVLRGMLFGISDDELYHYRCESCEIHLHIAADPDKLSAKGRKVDQALGKLRQYAAWAAELPALAAFMRIVDDIGLVQAAACGESGAIRSGTLIKLLEVLQRDAAASVDWQALTSRLQQLTERGSMEASSLFAGSGDAVRIMNLHKAKGLEAPVVLLACPCGNKDHDAAEHVDRMAEPQRGYFTISRQRDMYTSEIVAQPFGWAERGEKEREFMHAEAERLLYVAATRAMQLLIVSQYPTRPAIDPWGLLADSLRNQSELDIPPIAPVSAEELPAIPDVAGSLAEWQQRLAASVQPSYQIAGVTGLTKEASEIVLERSADGKGMAYGTLVHSCLQALGEGMERSDLYDFCRLAAEKDEDFEAEWLSAAEAAVLQVAESELWKRTLNARRKYHDFSFMTARPHEVSGSDSAMPTLLRGVIDLVFEEDDGWVIVDFKTDRYDMPQEQQFVEYYKPQVLAYKDEWERTIGGTVKEAGLYFIDTGRYIVL